MQPLDELARPVRRRAVRPAGARLEDERCRAGGGDAGAQGGGAVVGRAPGGEGRVQLVVRAAGGVGEEVAEGERGGARAGVDGGGVGGCEGDEGLGGEFGEVAVERVVEGDEAALDALEGADGGEELGAGGDEEGVVEGDGGRGWRDV